jgi:hypothetical protein
MSWNSATAHDDNMRWMLGRYQRLQTAHRVLCATFWVTQAVWLAVVLLIVKAKVAQ